MDLSFIYQDAQQGNHGNEGRGEKCKIVSALNQVHTLTFFSFQIFQHVEELFPLLLKTLSDPSDEVPTVMN